MCLRLIGKGLLYKYEAKKIGKAIFIISDVHSPEEADMASDVLDIIQLPAFLARQTDLVAALANTGKIINIKKKIF